MHFTGSVACEKLFEVLSQAPLLKAIKKASAVAQTSCLEGCHCRESVCTQDAGLLLPGDTCKVRT